MYHYFYIKGESGNESGSATSHTGGFQLKKL
jgi:hypothetical protein